MKLIIVLLCTVTAFTSYTQVPNVHAKVTSNSGQTVKTKTVKTANQNNSPNVLKRELILGNYQIDTIYTYNEDYTDEELPDFALNDTIRIIKDKIILKDGNHEFTIFDSEEMPKADYFYRMFLVTGDDYPADLPSKIAVHKTDNPHIYGLGLLANGTLLFPFEGQLIILKEIVPEKK